MRLSDVLSKTPIKEYRQIDGFLQGKQGNVGQRVDISVGRIGINYFCINCDDVRTFYSGDKLSVIFINKSLISINSVLICGCGKIIPVWFLVESNGDITGQAPYVKIVKKSEKLSDIFRNNKNYGEFAELLDKAEQAYNEELGAGSIVYLRKIFEKITIESAKAMNIEYEKYENGNPKNFSKLLEKVDRKCEIIPKEFSKDGYRLFRELSNIVHVESDEKIALSKFEALNRLVIGILENVKNHKEFIQAMKKLKWEIDEDNLNE